MAIIANRARPGPAQDVQPSGVRHAEDLPTGRKAATIRSSNSRKTVGLAV